MRTSPALEADLRLQLGAAQYEAAELRALVADLHEQLDRAHQATVRMARRVAVGRRAAA